VSSILHTPTRVYILNMQYLIKTDFFLQNRTFTVPGHEKYKYINTCL